MRKHSGFTLVELVIVLAVAAILTTLAAPSFRSMIQNNRATTQANALLSSMNLARSEAIKRGVRVTLCSSEDQASCTDPASDDWSTGWIVFADESNFGVKDAAETVLQVREALKGGAELKQTLPVGGSNVQFLPSGQSQAVTQLRLERSDCTGDQARTIDTARSGRSAVSTSAC